MGQFALAFAALAAVGYGGASILQAVAAGRSTGTLNTLVNPLYLIGVIVDLLAWLASLVALRTLAVYQVQSILAGSLAVTVLLARVVLKQRLRGGRLAAIAVTIIALALLAASSGPQQPANLTTPARLFLAIAAVVVALLGIGAVVAGRPNLAGALAGLAFGGAALCARAVTLPTHWGHPIHALAILLADPLCWGLAGFGVTGMLLYAAALEHGRVGPVTALLWITEVIAPSIVGALLLGDTVRSGWEPAALVALLAAVGSAALLAVST